jgi:hypothetical protein
MAKNIRPEATPLQEGDAAIVNRGGEPAAVILGSAAENSNSELRDRATHTGVQAIGTITGLQAALDGKAGTSAFSSDAAGLVPASGGGTTNFLRADGTFAAPPGAGAVAWEDVTGKPSFGGAAVLDVGTTAGTVAAGDDARLSDAREWTGATVEQAEAEEGTATTRRAWTAQRVFQAIAAWWAASAAKTKLDGIATGAQVNDTAGQIVTKLGTLEDASRLGVGALKDGLLVFDAGGNASVARPTYDGPVYWINTPTAPVNGVVGDLWFEAT